MYLCAPRLKSLSFVPPIAIRNRSRNRSTDYRRPSNCQASASKRVTLFTTGKKLDVHLAPSQSSDVLVYIVCPKCDSAYVGNAVKESLKVSCPSCDNVFQTSPSELYIETPLLPQPSKKPGSVICAHMNTCSGCTVSKSAIDPPILQEASEFLVKNFRVPMTPTVEMGPTHEWRSHAKLAIRRGVRGERVVIGLFKSHSHEVMAIPECAVHSPEINRAVELLRSVLIIGNIAPYDESDGSGLIRYGLFTVERASRLVQVTLVWNATSWKDAAPVAQQTGAELWRRGKNLLHSIWFNWNTTTTNAIVNPERERYYHMHGERDLKEVVCGVPLTYPPYVFRQSNLDAFEKMLLPRLFSYIPPNSSVAEFCAGVGVIGLAAVKAGKVKRLKASELHAAAEGVFWTAAKSILKSGIKASIHFVVGSDDETTDIIEEDTDVAIFDPPRGGLSDYVVDYLSKIEDEFSLHRIIYVSCGYGALKKNARSLCANGRWKLSAAHFYILFPGSDHIETLAIFDRIRVRPQRHRSLSTEDGKSNSGRNEVRSRKELRAKASRNGPRTVSRRPRG